VDARGVQGRCASPRRLLNSQRPETRQPGPIGHQQLSRRGLRDLRARTGNRVGHAGRCNGGDGSPGGRCGMGNTSCDCERSERRLLARRDSFLARRCPAPARLRRTGRYRSEDDNRRISGTGAPRAVAPHVTRGVAHAIETAMAHALQVRFATVTEFARALGARATATRSRAGRTPCPMGLTGDVR
jgi:hypothetical protein